jgi:hypothetical protein
MLFHINKVLKPGGLCVAYSFDRDNQKTQDAIMGFVYEKSMNRR